ncbi:MAG: IclR family transcriptional regulator domain-containing protein [Candidatus Rokuibacteriota bacterium]
MNCRFCVAAAETANEVARLLRARPPHRFSPRTLVARDALLEAVREVRRTGWAVSDEEGLTHFRQFDPGAPRVIRA